MIKFIVLYMVLLKPEIVISVHLKGSWDTKNSFNFLTKFAFQRTLQTDVDATAGYIFGNITSLNMNHGFLTLSVLPYDLFSNFYSNFTSVSNMTNDSCQKIFKEIEREVYDGKCQPTGKEDYFRHVPCATDSLCVRQNNLKNAVKDNQLTFSVKDFNNPKVWYVNIIACSRNEKCEWEYFNGSEIIDFDLTLVNGEPFTIRLNPFEYHFSFERMDTVETYLISLVIYSCFLAPIQLYATLKQNHCIMKLFSTVLVTQLIGLCLDSIHLVIYSFNGIGVEMLNIFGDVFNIIAQSLFVLLLLLLAKGWAIVQVNIDKKYSIIFLWTSYSILIFLLFFWNLVETDSLQYSDQYHTWPGWLTVGLRIVIMTWFLFELKMTMRSTKSAAELKFFLHFGAATLVWFIYLPATVLISTYISYLWRYKLMLGFVYSADCLAHSFMTFLLWPRRSQDYLILQNNFESDDFESYSESLDLISPVNT